MNRIKRPSLLALALLLALPIALASAPQEKLDSFSRFGKFVVEVDGKQDPQARIYHSQQPPAFLIHSPALSSDYVLHPRAYQVVSLDRQHVSEEAQGKIKITPGYSTETVGKFTVGMDQTVSLEADGHRIRLLPKGDLLGYHSGQDIFDYDYQYQDRANSFQPDAGLIEKIKSFDKQAELTIYFGSWCPNCQHNVPKVLRLEQELKGSSLSFSYYGIPRAPQFTQDPEVQKYKIERVPTGVLRSNGREVGRIEKDDWTKLEARILELLGQVK